MFDFHLNETVHFLAKFYCFRWRKTNDHRFPFILSHKSQSFIFKWYLSCILQPNRHNQIKLKLILINKISKFHHIFKTFEIDTWHMWPLTFRLHTHTCVQSWLFCKINCLLSWSIQWKHGWAKNFLLIFSFLSFRMNQTHSNNLIFCSSRFNNKQN